MVCRQSPGNISRLLRERGPLPRTTGVLCECFANHFAAHDGGALGASVVQIRHLDVVQAQAPEIVACRSWTWTGRSMARRPISSVRPMTWPFLMPPPAIHMVKPHGLWSRPLPFSLNGVRPNSPPHTTSVLSSSPRAFRSVSRPAIGLSVSWQRRVWLPVQVRVRVPSAAAAGIQFDETDAALHQPPRQQAVGAELRRDLVIHAVEFARGLRFLGEVHRFGRRRLHPVRQFVGVAAALPVRCPPAGRRRNGG